MVVMGQSIMVPFLTLTYLISPKTVHRFVGYLEETAVHTYTNILELMDKEGTNLNTEWKDLPAPNIAKAYWLLPKSAKWRDVLEQILADESHHRDVNHTFASLKGDDPNPYIHELLDDARQLWRKIDEEKKQEMDLRNSM